jgi:hypothetical protein
MDCDTGRLGVSGLRMRSETDSLPKAPAHARTPSNWAADDRAGKSGCKHTEMSRDRIKTQVMLLTFGEIPSPTIQSPNPALPDLITM